MSAAKIRGYVIRKGPKGYELSKLISMDGGKVEAEVMAYCSSFMEAKYIELNDEAEFFGESAYPYPTMPYAQQQAYTPPSERQYEPDLEMPNVARHAAIPEPDPGLVGRIRAQYNGTVSVWVPFLFLTAISLSMGARGWFA